MRLDCINRIYSQSNKLEVVASVVSGMISRGVMVVAARQVVDAIAQDRMPRFVSATERLGMILPSSYLRKKS